MEKQIMGMMMVIVMVAVLASVVQASPQPTADYCCPICAQLGTPQCFYTYAELEQHFVTEHPAIDISIIWD